MALPEMASLPTRVPDVRVTEHVGVVPVPELFAWLEAVMVIAFAVMSAVVLGCVRL
ncbi:MAG: hypothetical protein ACO4AZ_10780 [Ilumatobacteraceae bacterium]